VWMISTLNVQHIGSFNWWYLSLIILD
jgi:hypothetical protein